VLVFIVILLRLEVDPANSSLAAVWYFTRETEKSLVVFVLPVITSLGFELSNES
jgi:hypothetical protein